MNEFENLLTEKSIGYILILFVMYDIFLTVMYQWFFVKDIFSYKNPDYCLKLFVLTQFTESEEKKNYEQQIKRDLKGIHMWVSVQ